MDSNNFYDLNIANNHSNNYFSYPKALGFLYNN